jgi:hypothetical protein
MNALEYRQHELRSLLMVKVGVLSLPPVSPELDTGAIALAEESPPEQMLPVHSIASSSSLASNPSPNTHHVSLLRGAMNLRGAVHLTSVQVASQQTPPGIQVVAVVQADHLHEYPDGVHRPLTHVVERQTVFEHRMQKLLALCVLP